MPEEMIPSLQPLKVPIEEPRLLLYLNALQDDANKHWNGSQPEGKNLENRRNQNIKYLFGKQLLGRDLKDYESELLDNVIYEYEATLKSLATSKLPDIIMRAGGASSTPEKEITVELLTKVNENRMIDRKFKKALGILFKHLPAYFISVYKYRWDPNKNRIGEIVEEVIPPDKLILDHTATSADPDEMSFLIHLVSKSAKEWAMLFPKKEKEIIEFVAEAHPEIIGGDEDEAKKDWLLAQKIEASEFWFDWFDKADNFDVEAPKFDFMSGVAWKLGDELVLGSSKNPNWDYEGHDVITFNGESLPPEMMQQIITTGQTPPGFEVKKLFNNYFEAPKKPFILMSFDQFMRSAIDETSRIEQTIPMQKSLDVTGASIDHMIKAHKGKHIWSRTSGMTKKSLKDLDMNNPDIDVLIKGDPQKVHAFIQPVMPRREMFNHVVGLRGRMFGKVGTHG
ncbi:hypothetical protein LCGC14_1570280, partial [marine sediment metagenome]